MAPSWFPSRSLFAAAMLCWIGWLALPSSAAAAIVLLKDGASPVVGTIVRRDAERLVIRPQPAGDTAESASEKTLRLAEVAEIVETVSAERLAALNPAEPAAYREYAEELLARRSDREARETALRLFSIAAWLRPHELGRPALLGMIALARSPEEERKFRAALYVIDPRTKLATIPQVGAPSDDSHSAAAQELLRALRLLRTGKGPNARAAVEKPAVAKLLAGYSRLFTRAEFQEASSRSTLTPRELRQTLLVELELESLLAPAKPPAAEQAAWGWSRELARGGSEAVPSFDLETLTEFSPRKCLYRDGQWVEQ
jgi:hypothetical protein